MTEVPIIQKPVNWHAEQISGLVSIWKGTVMRDLKAFLYSTRLSNHESHYLFASWVIYIGWKVEGFKNTHLCYLWKYLTVPENFNNSQWSKNLPALRACQENDTPFHLFCSRRLFSWNLFTAPGLKACIFYRKETLTQVLCWGYWKIFRDTSFS